MSEKVEDRCSRCGQVKRDHVVLTYAEGPREGQEIVICQTALFASQTEADEQLQQLADAS